MRRLVARQRTESSWIILESLPNVWGRHAGVFPKGFCVTSSDIENMWWYDVIWVAPKTKWISQMQIHNPLLLISTFILPFEVLSTHMTYILLVKVELNIQPAVWRYFIWKHLQPILFWMLITPRNSWIQAQVVNGKLPFLMLHTSHLWNPTKPKGRGCPK